MNVASVVLAVLLAVFFLPLGTAKILALPQTRQLAVESGFSVTAYRAIGVLEAAAAVGLLLGLAIPLLGGLAGTGLLLLMTGALVTHLRQGDGPRKFAPAVIVALLVTAYLATHLATA
ncbi:DoxX family protein [Streptomyces sp. ADMS]|uniref:DoxX family protein n=1 Tax=Streptomyces sp. ADMS TaxID=3071415 RepID=UPI002970019B|nr:DoxX family protein [Streptomyces sp. ADMS]MDW4907700.1 DoxX family protein [Streptomyces sp. ADMS]